MGVNLMPDLWAGRAPRTGRSLLIHRRDVLEHIAEAGLDHVMLGDHVMFHDGVGNDGLTDTASVVTANDTLDVYLSLFLLVLRHPVVVARQLLTVDQLAPGRLTLGVGIGGDDRHEVEVCGVDPRTRGRRMDEALELFRRLIAGETVDHAGEFFTVANARLRPAPDVPVPIVVGGRSDAALRRAGRFGDGWLGIWNSARRCLEAIAAVEQHAAQAGRTDVVWQHGMTFWCGFGADRAEARNRVAPVMEGLYRLPFDAFERHIPLGTPAQVAEYVAPYLETGVTTLNFIPFAASERDAVDAVAEVRHHLLRSR